MVPFMSHGSAAGGVVDGYWQVDYQGSQQGRRGQSVVEFYNNTITGRRVDWLCQLRGSANSVWGNTCYTNTAYSDTPAIYLREEESYESASIVGATVWNSGTTYTTGNVVSHVEGSVTRYYTATSVGGNLNRTPPNTTYWTPPQWNPPRLAWPAEDQVHNTYICDNNCTRLGGGTGSIVIAQEAPYIVQNRDFFLHAPAATGGYEYFTGVNGASNSYPTDGVAYPTYGTMLFNPTGSSVYYGYVPYTYPHPLAADFIIPTRAGSVGTVGYFLGLI
jgi:hypothetical protein